MKEKKWIKWIFVISIISLMGLLSTASIVTKDKMYSSSEKRMLETTPNITKKTILNGTFQKNYETYLSDQFWERDTWITLKNVIERILGKKEANGVYFGKDDYLFEHEKASDFQDKQIKKNIKLLSRAVKHWEKKYGQEKVKVLFVPSKSIILQDKLPLFAPQYEEESWIPYLEQEVGQAFLYAKDALQKAKDEYIFYRTDHHWTTNGAYVGYRLWANTMGLTPWEKEEYKKKTVTNHFLGTTYAKINMGGKADSIDLYYPKKKMEYYVKYNMGEKESDSLYELDKLKKSDKYEVFFGGNQGILEIKTNQKNGKTLFVVKDSFANSFLPFAINHFETTIVVDLRHINASVSQIMELYKPTDVLVLYNTSQFMQSSDISKLK